MLLYSTAIHPPQQAIDTILGLRAQVKDLAGEFKRYNTTPHITINVFTPFFLSAWQQHINRKLSAIEPLAINFELQFFVNPKQQNSHLVFAPVGADKEKLIAFIKSINTGSPKALKKINTPHLTVAYSLNRKQANAIQKQLSTLTTQLQFTIDRLVIRRREDDALAEYQLHSEHLFSNPVI
ncbi:MAG TPA: 2'-5' RNA ligase family protein [Chitinophagales bacterium]|nr:2'-5' RNA ligase family protein [Chitinophagales bacterium]